MDRDVAVIEPGRLAWRPRFALRDLRGEGLDRAGGPFAFLDPTERSPQSAARELQPEEVAQEAALDVDRERERAVRPERDPVEPGLPAVEVAHDRELGVRELAREDAYHAAVRPPAYVSLGLSLLIACVLGLSPLGARIVEAAVAAGVTGSLLATPLELDEEFSAPLIELILPDRVAIERQSAPPKRLKF